MFVCKYCRIWRPAEEAAEEKNEIEKNANVDVDGNVGGCFEQCAREAGGLSVFVAYRQLLLGSYSVVFLLVPVEASKVLLQSTQAKQPYARVGPWIDLTSK